MAIRITGLNSGLDTESIITELVKAKQTNVDKLKKEQTKLSWKIDAWKGLNTKVVNLWKGTVDKLRFDNAYVKKKTTASNNVLSVVAGSNAANGVQSAYVESLAKAAYLTGGKLQTAEGGKVSGDTKLTDLGLEAGKTFSVTAEGKTTEIEITEDMTMNDLVSSLKKTGLVVNFDEAQQRLFINAKDTGVAHDFSFGGDEETLKTLGLVADPGNPNGAVKLDASNAVMYLNGARFESDTNTFQINGSTYTAKEVSEKNADGTFKETTITTADDYDGIYDTIKNFITEYNKLINEMDKLYNADAAKDYEPLTAEEKEALTETEIGEWETKIKDSLLRKDSSLNSVINSMTTAMQQGFKVNGQTMYLSNFGIKTMGYFEAAENEKHAFHIDGDADDASASGNTDLLMSMIASDPDAVKSFFSQLANGLYDAMNASMSSVQDFKSYQKVYNDKQMDKELKDYEKKIADAEEKLKAYEDKWYDKFSAMEVALSKMSSKQNAIASLFSQ